MSLGRLAWRGRGGCGLAAPGRLDSVTRGESQFQFGNLVPLGVGAISLRHREQFPQAAAKVAVLFVQYRVTHGLGYPRLASFLVIAADRRRPPRLRSAWREQEETAGYSIYGG